MSIKQLVDKQREYFKEGNTKSYEFRKAALKKLYDTIIQHEELIKEALYLDLNKSSGEAYLTEIGVTLKEINYLLKHLRKLMKDKKVKTGIAHFPAVSRISPSPYGVTLIMSPWNYPIYLTLASLAGTIAAGNTAIVKPSNYSSNTSNAIETLIKTAFEEEYIAVVKGGEKKTRICLIKNLTIFSLQEVRQLEK